MKTEVTIDKLKRIISAFEDNGIKYLVIAGFGLDGRRGFQTRSHQDLDVLCLKADLPKIEKTLKFLDYSGEKHNNLYKVFGKDKGKMDVALLEIEGDEAISYGKIAVTRFPKVLLGKPQIGKINNFEFKIAPDELLKTWAAYSRNKDDLNYTNRLVVDEGLMKKIKRTMRKD